MFQSTNQIFLDAWTPVEPVSRFDAEFLPETQSQSKTSHEHRPLRPVVEFERVSLNKSHHIVFLYVQQWHFHHFLFSHHIFPSYTKDRIISFPSYFPIISSHHSHVIHKPIGLPIFDCFTHHFALIPSLGTYPSEQLQASHVARPFQKGPSWGRFGDPIGFHNYIMGISWQYMFFFGDHNDLLKNSRITLEVQRGKVRS